MAEAMAPEDKRECRALGFQPKQALKASIANAIEHYVISYDGVPAIMLGVSRPSELSETNLAWLVATPVILEHPFLFLEYSKIIHEAWVNRYRVLTNYVDVRHTRAVRWLQWLGADMKLLPSVPPYGRAFYKFTLESDDVRRD